MKYQRLLEPGYIGKIKTRNRLIKTAASMNYTNEKDIEIGDVTKAFYEALACGGIGLLIVESPTVDYPDGARWRERQRIDDDIYIKGYKNLTDIIHKYNCPTFLQMRHDGPWQNPLFAGRLFEGHPIGSSPTALPEAHLDFHRDVPRVLSVSEIEAVSRKFIDAAVRAQKAGFDGIDINAASSHIFHNFLSPFWNRREDEYGGSLENRAKLLLNTIDGIKKACGNDFPVEVLINGIEIGKAVNIDNSICLTHEESKKIALMLQDVGVDAIQIRNHWLGYHSCGILPDYLFYPEPLVQEESFPEEYNYLEMGRAANEYLTEEMKKILSIPVIAVGKMDAEVGERLLKENKADFIGMTRHLLADPEYPNKLIRGKSEEIAPCTACVTCLDRTIQMPGRCRINAAIGGKKQTVEKAEKSKNVVIVGAGPAGMEAARVSAMRGHKVTIFEKTSRLGGQMRLASFIKGTEIENLPDMIKYYQNQMEKLGVNIVLGKEFTPVLAEKIKPDVIIVAAGGKFAVPEIEGIGKRNVITMASLHKQVKPYLNFFGSENINKLSKVYLSLGKRVIVIGAGLHGLEAAEFLIKRCRKVTLVESSSQVGEEMIDIKLGLLMDWFSKKKVEIYTGVKSMRITEKGMEITTADDKNILIEADNILQTSRLSPNKEVYASLKGKAPEVYEIGDCREPHLIVDAVADAWKLCNTI